MSDENNKLVRQSHEIAPAEGFARKIEERLRAEPMRESERECAYAFKFDNDVITRCVKRGTHVEHQNGMAFWQEGCQSVSPDGEPCIYQLQHEGDHGNGRDSMWGQQEIAQVEANPLDALNVLSELMQRSPAFQQYVARRAAASRPIVQRSPLRPTRDWQVPFGPAEIQPQSSATFVQQLQMYFRGEKLVNTGDVDGLYIENIFVGARQQMPGGQPGIGVRAFEPASLSSGIRFDTVQPGLNISMIVRNVSNEVRTFAATMFGKVVV